MHFLKQAFLEDKILSVMLMAVWMMVCYGSLVHAHLHGLRTSSTMIISS